MRNLQDMPHTYEHFWETCFASGTNCALYKSSDTSPSDISARFTSWIAALDAAPAPYRTSTSVKPVTPYTVAMAMFRPMYAPMRLFPQTASIIAEAMAGNYTGIFDAAPIPIFDDICPLKNPESYTWSRDAMVAIACGDAHPQDNLTIAEFQAYIAELKAQDPSIGPFWSRIREGCVGWHYRPKYNFAGPWITPEHDPSGVPGKPLAPILFVSSKYDPVTPLRNAREMAKYHPGSGLLIQDNVGHGTGGTPGKCRDQAIKRFFDKGEVPDGELHCTADCRPFEDCGDELAVQSVPDRRNHRLPLEILW
jgi:pimeloyl-ACP methyl ester carboxylesterase